MSRTGEVALGIIGTILNVIFLIMVTLAVVFTSTADSSEITQMFEKEMMLQDPTMTSEDVAMFNEVMDGGLEIAGILGWVLIVTLLISVILSIIGVVKVSKNKSPKAAGALFISAGMLSGILLLAPILFYIATIMCFVRKPPANHKDDPFYNNEEQQTNQKMRPL